MLPAFRGMKGAITGWLDSNQLVFAYFWPPGTEDVVREFLRTKYDPHTMPVLLTTCADDGSIHLLGWDSADDEPGLLEVARGWPLTDDERAWVEAATAALVARDDEGH